MGKLTAILKKMDYRIVDEYALGELNKWLHLIGAGIFWVSFAAILIGAIPPGLGEDASYTITITDPLRYFTGFSILLVLGVALYCLDFGKVPGQVKPKSNTSTLNLPENTENTPKRL